MEFEFASAGRVLFGSGSSEKLSDLVSSLDVAKLLFVTGKTGADRYGRLIGRAARDVETVVFVVGSEPSVENIREGVRAAAGCQAVISIGGGSVIDAGKAIAAVATNGGEPLDFCEVVGKGLALQKSPLPFIAVPTTAGTGAEVTKNAVITSVEDARKVSIRSNSMLPTFAVIDPLLQLSAPPAVTAASGMDALTQCIEPYTSKNANAMVDVLAMEGIRRCAKSLRKAYFSPGDIEARTNMAMAALLGGLSLANAKLGAVHGFAGVIGGLTNAPHGSICAALLAPVFRLNAEAVDTERRSRFQRVAAALTGRQDASIDDGFQWLRNLGTDLGIPSLEEMGLKPSQFPAIAEKSRTSSSMKGNPVELSSEQLCSVLNHAYHSSS